MRTTGDAASDACVGVRQDDRGGTVAVHVAVVQAERVGDHARREVLRQRERVAVDRVGVELRVAAGGERDLGQLLACRAVLVEVAPREQGETQRSRAATERRDPPPRPVDGWGRLAPVTHPLTGAPLGHRPVGHDVADEAGIDREAAGEDGAELRRSLEVAEHDVDLEPQRVVHVGERRSREPGTQRGPAAGIRREPADVTRREPGVVQRRGDGVERERERRPPEAPPDGRLPDARDDDPILELRVGARHVCLAATAAAGGRRPISRDMVRG